MSLLHQETITTYMQQVCHYTAVVDLRLLEAERLVDRVTELLELVFWEAYLLEPLFFVVHIPFAELDFLEYDLR